MMGKTWTVKQIAEAVGGSVEGNEDLQLTGIASLEAADKDEISFLTCPAFAKYLATTDAAAVLVQRETEVEVPSGTSLIRVDSPAEALEQVLALFAEPIPAPPPGVHPSAQVAESAQLGKDVAVGPGAVIGANTVIGERTVIHPAAVVGEQVTIGANCVLWPGVVIRERCRLGDRIVVHPNAVIGADGFGYRFSQGRHVKIPQIGTVVIEDDVEIGACTCVDRAKFGQTRIRRGTKIDNLVQIAHNCEIGEHSVLAAQIALAGSVKIGKYVVIGGQVGIRDHAHIGDAARFAGGTGVANLRVRPGQAMAGYPARDAKQWARESVALSRLPQLLKRVSALEKKSSDTTTDDIQTS